MNRITSVIVVLSLVALSCAEKARYDNYQVYKLTPKTIEEVAVLIQMQDDNEFSFWNDPTGIDIPVNVMVAPHQRVRFEEFLQEHPFENELTIPNVQNILDEEDAKQRIAPRGMEWKNYHSLKDIYDWLDDLEKKFKEVKVVFGGKTHEGRDIKGIEINFGKNLTNVFIEGGIHAREWISPAATTYLIHEVLNSTSDSILRKFNYLYFPVYNPDGYAYSWEKDRMWRKTRTPYKSGTKICYGADPNRNWDCHWGEGGGSSKDPCSEVYAGPKAFSEIETRSMANYTAMRQKTDRRSDIYLAFHSYSQLLMFPWGYTTDPAKENDIWQKIGDKAAAAIKECYGKIFRVGRISTTIYKVSGSSIEWYYDKLNPFIPFVYELRDTGLYGFLLPADQIIPSGREVVASVKTIFEEYKKIKKNHSII